MPFYRRVIGAMPDPEIMMMPMPPRRVFALRMLRSGAIAIGVIGTGLLIGMTGYHWLGRLPWVDALLNASMILAGMGPVDPLPNDAAKNMVSSATSKYFARTVIS